MSELDRVNKIINYLREHAIVDFQGALSLEMIRDILKNDNSAEAERLLAKLIENGSTDEMFLALSDRLLPWAQNVLKDEVVLNQLVAYSES